jgi:hypothetical protein
MVVANFLNGSGLQISVQFDQTLALPSSLIAEALAHTSNNAILSCNALVLLNIERGLAWRMSKPSPNLQMPILALALFHVAAPRKFTPDRGC